MTPSTPNDRSASFPRALAPSRWLRRLAVATAVAGALGAGTAATAATVNLTFVGALNAGSTVTRTISDSTTGAQTATTVIASMFEMNNGTDPVYAYCLEPQQSVGNGTFTEGPLTAAPGNLGGMSATRAGQVALLFGQVTDPFSSALAADQQAAIQIALWEIIRENSGTLNVTGGTTFFGGPTPANALTLAQGYLDNVTNNVGTPLAGLMSLTNANLQDLVVLVPRNTVPEPGTLLLVGGALAFLRRRKA